ncbi:MAG: MlaD family protein [Saprospiraceae bacterium]
MTRELKIGLLTVLSLVVAIWGYTFLKGKNLLSSDTQIKTTFGDVTGLEVSSPVLVNGYKIGSVTSIKMNHENVKLMDVFFLVNNDFKIPKNAIVNLKSTGIIDGKGLFISFDKPCSGADCVESGDVLEGRVVGFIEGMIGDKEIEEYSSDLTKSAKELFKTLGKEGEEGAIHATVRNIEHTSLNANKLTEQVNTILLQNSTDLRKIMGNMNSLTSALAKSNQNIESMIANLNKVTTDLAQSNLKETVEKTNATLGGSKIAVDELTKTLTNANTTLNELNQVLAKASSGNGTIAKLLNDKNLYTNIELTTRNLNFLLQDLRLNPKRYAHFSLFGKKQKEFTTPENDPLNQKIEEK